jgi:hypothetical protein
MFARFDEYLAMVKRFLDCESAQGS